jgi:hypothetical protein
MGVPRDPDAPHSWETLLQEGPYMVGLPLRDIDRTFLPRLFCSFFYFYTTVLLFVLLISPFILPKGIFIISFFSFSSKY